MNTQALNKCLEELKKETPNISYVLGVLETVIEMSGTPLPISNQPSYVQKPIQRSETVSDEEREYNPLTSIGPIGNLTA